MCNLYTYKHSREEMARSISSVSSGPMSSRSGWRARTTRRWSVRSIKAPVVIVPDGERELADMGWGVPAPVPPLTPGETPKRPRENLR